MMKPNFVTILFGLALASGIANSAPVNFIVDASAAAKPISPYIYGKNHGISQTTGVSTPADTIQRYKDVGLKMIRLNNGNNASKYNWEKKLSSHPDWYNNVYDNDWDQSASEMASKLPGVQGLYALSLLGWAANNKTHNFNDWLYNGSAWWWDDAANTSGTGYDWAGTPAITVAGQKPTVAPDPTLYLEKRTLDQTLGIIDHFFGTGATQLNLNQNQFLYWNMDNEADIWNGTHSDVMGDTMSAEEFIKIYVDMAVKARTKFPNIKLVGPVVTNEWQWYFWQGGSLISSGGKNYSYMEYFIKRVAEEQTRTGLRLLDVVDYHFYPGYDAATDKANIMQMHRVWFDTSYVFPKANAVKQAFAGTSKEFIFQRTRNWLTTYFGNNHGITLGITECGAIDGAKADASVAAVWYASQLGEFASQGDVEIFTPWTEYQGMFEALHLFTKYGKEKSLPARNSTDNLVSVYPTISADGDSLTMIIVNRNLTAEQEVAVSLNGFVHGGTWAPTFDLANLQGETFQSESKNALYNNGVNVASGAFSITVPKVSVTAIVLSTTNPGTKPSFPARTAISSSSSATGSSSAAGGQLVVWDYTMGAQVKQPGNVTGGWWYNYADELSTISAISAADISAKQGLNVVFTGVQSAEQTYNYAGLGFNWANTPPTQNILTVNLSTYSGICVTYKSTVGIRAAIGQPDPAAPTKAINYTTDDAVLPASDVKTTTCLPWSTFPAGTALNLAKQSAFQMQVGETADFTIYSIALKQGGTGIRSIAKATPQFGAFVRDNLLHVSLNTPTSGSLRLLDLMGHEVQRWNIDSHKISHSLSLNGIKAGRYLVHVPYLGTRSIVISK